MSKRILVVDDNIMNLIVAESILQEKGYEILRAESGEECLKILQSEKTDLILLDVKMPGMSGFELTLIAKPSLAFIPLEYERSGCSIYSPISVLL